MVKIVVDKKRTNKKAAEPKKSDKDQPKVVDKKKIKIKTESSSKKEEQKKSVPK